MGEGDESLEERGLKGTVSRKRDGRSQDSQDGRKREN